MSGYQPMPLHLQTARLALRPWAESDAVHHRALAGERGEGLPSLESSQEVAAKQIATPAQNGFGLYAVDHPDEGGFIGYCGLIVGRSSLEEPEIAYELFRRTHGRGYATEAATAVLAAAIETGRHRLWATVRDWNAPSFRVLEKLGFGRDHVTTDEQGELVWLTRELP